MPIRYDILGCGAVIQRYHVPVIQRLKREASITVRGCFDLNIHNARKVARLVGALEYGLPSDIGRFDNVDAAIIATPPDSHATLARAYLSAGKHVFIEKPFTVRSAEARDLVGMSKRNNVHVLVNHFRRFYPSVRLARKFVKYGGLGRIHRIEASEGTRWNWPVTSEYVVRSPYGGVVYDTGAHLIDMVLFILSLDDLPHHTRYHIQRIVKKPSDEPSHECFATVQVFDTIYGTIDIHISLSRIQPLAGIVKVHGEHGILLIPTSFAASPVLYIQRGHFTLGEPDIQPRPIDALGCFIISHREFLRRSQDAIHSSLLDGHRFLLLVSILESLVEK